MAYQPGQTIYRAIGSSSHLVIERSCHRAIGSFFGFATSASNYSFNLSFSQWSIQEILRSPNDPMTQWPDYAALFRLMRLATNPAPNPLSILTTATLDAQLLSIASKAV